MRNQPYAFSALTWQDGWAHLAHAAGVSAAAVALMALLAWLVFRHADVK